MKKTFNFYIVAWVIALAIFNVIAFVAPSIPGGQKFTASFWIGYIFITIALIGQVVCAYKAFQADTAKKMFYNISLIRISYTGLIFSFIVGGALMLFSYLPYWFGVIVCVLVLAFNATALIKANVAINEIERIDEKVDVQTLFIKSLTVEADTLMAIATSEAIKAECRKVYEAIRYSDPMSHEALATMESQITVKFAELSEDVKADDFENTEKTVNELMILLEDRNKKCKLFK